MEDLEETIQEIENLIRANRSEAIIAGDFNAKSPQWGMDYTDARGSKMTEWIAANNLIVLNEGNTPTFVNRNYGSILDITLSTEKIRPFITGWKVLEEESLSDHKYIMFEVHEENNSRETIPQIQGWQLKKLDQRKLQVTLSRIAEYQTLLTPEKFSEKLTEICDLVMPKKRSGFFKRPAYWWNNDIAELRKDCQRKRRAFTRNARRLTLLGSQNLWEEYKKSRKTLRNSIKKSKRECWTRLCADVDRDIWGDGYKIVMKNMLGFPPKINFTMDDMEKVKMYLFPHHADVHFTCNRDNRFHPFTEEEIEKASSRLKPNKAPGPGGIPSEIVKALILENPKYPLIVYNQLAKEGIFPDKWKTAKLLLLRKGNKPPSNPSSFRPICLLDTEGKLYEHLLLERLNEDIIRTGGLSPQQFGFRRGCQTVDAVISVLDIAREAKSQRKICAAITLDVRNAFNSASWQLILEELRKREMDESLITIIASYLSERKLLLETKEGVKYSSINSGVPQGSVLGPTLWNILYDSLFKIKLPEEATLVGFADDVVLIIKAKNEEILTNTANRSLLRVSDWMESKHLELAPEKTEAVVLTSRRKMEPITFDLNGTVIRPSKAIKYLGVWLDTKMTFAEHVSKTITKGEKTVSALASLMPNIGGPRASKRRVISSVVHSQVLYGAPAWHTVTQNKTLSQKLTSLQRKMLIRICSAYRTISAEGASVIAGIPPIVLQIKERKERHTGIDKDTARENLLRNWQRKWENGKWGRWTYGLIPNIERWIGRTFGEVDYYLTQALSGHGCFRKYLFDRRRADSPNCPYCTVDDDVGHTLFRCARWVDTRTDYYDRTRRVFNPENMMDSLIGGENEWNHAYETIREIIETKERESRN